MQGGQFPASAANSLIQGYCDDFISLAAVMAQTLEQVSMRGLNFDESRPALERIERGMCSLAAAIHELLGKGPASTASTGALRNQHAEPASRHSQPAAAPAPSAAPRHRASPPAASPPVRKQPTTPASTSWKPKSPPLQSLSTRRAQPSPTLQNAGRPAPVTVEPPAPREGRTESLRGTNKSMPLLSVFQFLGRMRKSGTVHVFVGGEILAFEFANGCIQSTASDLCPSGERLGDLLIELGFCSREALDPILAQVGATAVYRLGQYVVDNGIASNGQVLEALEEQVKRRFRRVCKDAEAAYQFEEGRRPPGDGRIRIAPFELAFEPAHVV
jgi:hypothetical protein